jgi:hypothetical protein
MLHEEATFCALECFNTTIQDLKQQPSFDTTRTAKKVTPPILPCRGNVFTKPLPSNERGDTQTDGWDADKIAAGAMIYIPSFIKIGSGVES